VIAGAKRVDVSGTDAGEIVADVELDLAVDDGDPVAAGRSLPGPRGIATVQVGIEGAAAAPRPVVDREQELGAALVVGGDVERQGVGRVAVADGRGAAAGQQIVLSEG